MNNKMIKGSVAGATGIVLLMGGFGTYALWSDSYTMEESEITSGVLDVEPLTVSWTDQNDDAWSATDLMVPGDTVKRTQDLKFTATGKNMEGTIKFSAGSTTEPANAAGPGASLADSFSVDVLVTGITDITGSGGCYEFTSADFSETASTTVTYALTADNQDLQGAMAALEDSTFTIEQGHTCP